MNIKKETQGFDISDKSCCLIGCGGLGCNIAVHMVGAGIGQIYLCDFDTVSKSNLNRQFLYKLNDVGKKKCFVMKDRLCDYSLSSDFKTVSRKITSCEDLKFADNCDIILCAVDNPGSRKIIEKYCDETKKPMVCGGIDGFYGFAYLYVPDSSPSPALAGFSVGNKAKSSISASAGIIGSAQASLAIQYLLTKNNDLSGKLLIYDGANFETLPLKGI